MDEAKKKVKKFDPIVRARKAQLDQEQAILAALRQKRLDAVDELRSNQKIYMDGVNKLNRERKSGNMKALLTLESTLDTIKATLYENIKEVRHRENEEKIQIDSVINAQTRLKAIEKLTDKYSELSHQHQQKKEQKTLDELASQWTPKIGK